MLKEIVYSKLLEATYNRLYMIIARKIKNANGPNDGMHNTCLIKCFIYFARNNYHSKM